MNPRVAAVAPLADYKLELKFLDGSVRVFDMTPYLEFGVFQELKDVSYFKLVTVKDGSIFWPNEQDLCPDTLFEESA